MTPHDAARRLAAATYSSVRDLQSVGTYSTGAWNAKHAAKTVRDVVDQADRLVEAVNLLVALHRDDPLLGRCLECHYSSPCPTIKVLATA